MSFGVKGQWKANIKIEGYEPEPNAIASILVIEEAGNVLPVLEITLRATKPELFEYINKSSKLSLLLCKDDDTPELYSEFNIVKNNNLPESPGTHKMVIRAILDANDYLFEQVITSYEGNATYAIEQALLANNFKPKVNYNSSDKQIWLRPNMTTQKFINDILLHTYADDKSTFSVGIHHNREVIITDLYQELINAKPENLMAPMEGKGYLYRRIQPVRNNFAFYDALTRAGKSSLNFDQIKGQYEALICEQDKITTSELPTVGNFQRLSQLNYMNDNTHENYHKASLTQPSNLSKLQNFQTLVEFGNQYLDLKLLDAYTVIFPQDDITNLLCNETYSGKWVITKVIRLIEGNQLYTTAEISREGINKV